MTSFDVRAAVLAEAISRVKHAAARDWSRPILATISFEGDADGLCLVAADNYRIAVQTIEVEGGAASKFGIAPIRLADVPGILWLLKGSPKGSAQVGRAASGRVTFEVPGRSLTLKPVDGAYPKWREIFAKAEADATSVVSLNPAFLADAGKAAKGAHIVRVGSGQANDPVVVAIKGDGYTEAIMPVRVVTPADLPEAVS